uniref:Uncharacterized protein n=1 Tax=Panagrolaimus sp. ES5 TaxID=591445 RepID=A0AC34GNJ8_9BILA
MQETAALAKLSDFTDSNDLQAKKDSYSWNKTNKHLSSNFLNLNQESEAQHEFKKSKSTNNSTLFLHIAAYENDTADSNDSNTGGSKSKNEKMTLIKKRRASKQFLTDSSSLIANPFEFPRQQDNRSKHPEIMQFKPSQRLRNPNENNTVPNFLQLSRPHTVVPQNIIRQPPHRGIWNGQNLNVGFLSFFKQVNGIKNVP